MPEEREQMDFVRWFRETHPDLEKSLRVSMAGIKIAGGRRWGAILWNKMRALGVNKGEPDIALLLARNGYNALLIEHKGEGMSRKLSEDQEEHIDWHNANGNLAVQTRGLDELIATVKEYLDGST